MPFDVVVVDDGSRDATPQVLAELGPRYPFLHVVTHLRQRGIADALRSAADVGGGDILVFYPADLQYRPEDIPRAGRAAARRPRRHRDRHQAGQVREGLRLDESTTASAAGCSACA